jgi:hypothetical protein
MRDLNVTGDPSKIGFYSGLVVSVIIDLTYIDKALTCNYKESAFAVCQLVSIYPWGLLSGMGVFLYVPT